MSICNLAKHIALMLFALITLMVNAQESLRDWNYETIDLKLSGSNSYLEENHIYWGAHDKNGLIWLSTLFGVVYFDGQQIKLHPVFQSEAYQY